MGLKPSRIKKPPYGAELSYALVKGGYFGNATLKDVIETFQYIFQKKAGNYTKKYQEILCREKGTATFLNKLTSDFEKWIEGTEEKHFR